jgi:small subunit ribosomal protein S4e
VVKGKVQLNLEGGRNILVKEAGYKTGDAVLIDLGKKNEIKQKIGLEKNVQVYLTGGKHIGQTGKVQDITDNRVLCKAETGEVIETLKRDVFPIGKDKPLIDLTGR